MADRARAPIANADSPTRSCLPRDVETMAAIPAGWTELESFDRLSVPVRMFKSDASGLRVSQALNIRA